jgi:uncharacterized protein
MSGAPADDVAVLWRRVDTPGHEAARLRFEKPRWHLFGTAVLASDGTPCRLDYRVECDAAWRTLQARVDGWMGETPVRLEISADSAGRWRMNGEEVAAVAGCVDVDLGFSPSTNTLPIRRLGLAVGERAAVRAAWVTFPALTLMPLDQVYSRSGPETYTYESGGGAFRADLTVGAGGLVLRYGDIWQADAGG